MVLITVANPGQGHNKGGGLGANCKDSERWRVKVYLAHQIWAINGQRVFFTFIRS